MSEGAVLRETGRAGEGHQETQDWKTLCPIQRLSFFFTVSACGTVVLRHNLRCVTHPLSIEGNETRCLLVAPRVCLATLATNHEVLQEPTTGCGLVEP